MTKHGGREFHTWPGSGKIGVVAERQTHSRARVCQVQSGSFGMSEYIEYLREVFEEFGPITARKMFGGYGIYHDGLMFALVADETLYLKVDAENLVWFEDEGLGPFMYEKNGRSVKMSYYLAPDDMMEDRELAAVWAHRSFEAALRAQAAKVKSGRKR
jgi:DNA transformation protein and related proteins